MRLTIIQRTIRTESRAEEAKPVGCERQLNNNVNVGWTVIVIEKWGELNKGFNNYLFVLFVWLGALL